MDWSLRACSREDHLTYAPDEDALRVRLHTTTPAGEAWRCLRCGTFVVGDPRGHGPADEAPQPLRGRALRDAFILRILAVERSLRGILLALVGVAMLRFKSSEASLRQLFDRDLPALKPFADKLNVNLDKTFLVRELRHLFTVKQSTLGFVAAFLFVYAAIEIVEAYGLWRLRRWGEYFAVVATAIFIPLEVYELTDKFNVTKVFFLVLNVAAVIYLIASKRLFGVRGGTAAYEAQRESVSLLEVESMAGVTPESDPDPGPADQSGDAATSGPATRR